MKPNRTFTAIPADNREWTRFLQGLFYAREFTMTLVGCTTLPTSTARYTVSAGIVCIALPLLTGTSNDVLAVLEGMPDEITPEHDQRCIAAIVDNGVTTAGIIQIGTDTGITLFKDLAGSAFTAAGTKGIRGCSIMYPLD